MKKNEKGVAIIDVVLAVIIFSIFIVVSIGLEYNFMLKINENKKRELATFYAVKIAEYIQGEVNYDDVETNLDLSSLNIPSEYRALVSISSPTYDNIENPRDIIKIVNINVSYDVLNSSNQYVLETLKVKENI